MSDRPKDQNKILLRRLCKDYVWHILMGANGGGIDADRLRSECHIWIITLLNDIGYVGSMGGVFHHLDKLGFPTDYNELTDVEQWDRIARTVGNKAYEKLAENFYEQTGNAHERRR